MIILGVETSCDETGASVLSKRGDRIEILSNVLSSSASLQSKYGGIIPEQAAREQIKAVTLVIEEALSQAKVKPEELGAIAVTYGPGLIGSLLVGVETAKTLSWVWKKPLIPVNHLIGHFYANWIMHKVKFPFVGLLVSGGHSDLVLFKGHDSYEYLGGTRDDAAGECFDKCARMLGYKYPGGPKISKMAQKGDPKAFNLPRPMKDSQDFDFSFSGLKTAFYNLVETTTLKGRKLNDLCASLEQAIIDSLIEKVIKAAQINKVDQIIVAGGVAANEKLISELKDRFKGVVLSPPPFLCTDNGAMIAARGLFERPIKNPLTLQAKPGLSLSLDN